VTRSRASARAAGTRFETSIVGYLAAELDDDRIERRAKNGARDRGDVTGLRTTGGGRIVLEAKDYGGRLLPGEWLREADIERGNDGAIVGAVVAKRRGITDPGAQVVLMTVRDLVALISGHRPEESA
jgi:hypothetical protein